MMEKNERLDKELKQKEDANIWEHINAFFEVYSKMKKGEWKWILNPECKYVNLRVDMRDGGCIIENRHGKRILPEHLAFQWKPEDGITGG